MEFLANNSISPPKNLYPCLATIAIHPATEKARRLSASSFGSAGDNADDNVLKRIASGGRRKSSFGAADGERKKSIAPGGAGGGVGGDVASGGVPERGTWYWRVQAGVTENALLLLPLTQPPNPVLTTPPQPLSHAMPAHSAKEHPKEAAAHAHDQEEGIVDKMKNLFRRGSANPTPASTTGGADQAPAAAVGQGGDRVVDQTPSGDQLPSAGGLSAGATNVNANAETGWPGTINGEKLQAVVVPLNQIDKAKVHLGGGKRGEASFVTVPVTSHFAAMTVGANDAGHSAKSGTLTFEFDKDWIGAKAEAELLHHYLTTALTSDRSPVAQTFQLGTGHPHPQGGQNLPSSHPNPGMEERLAARRLSQGAPEPMTHPQVGGGAGSANSGVTPDESVSSGRKVAGET